MIYKKKKNHQKADCPESSPDAAAAQAADASARLRPSSIIIGVRPVRRTQASRAGAERAQKCAAGTAQGGETFGCVANNRLLCTAFAQSLSRKRVAWHVAYLRTTI